jgi:penicillin-insensitive murein endopeptidase
LLALGGALALVGCGRAPSPLFPSLTGSIGVPHRGVLVASVEMPAEGTGYRFLRDNDRHHTTPRFADALTRAAAHVESERPGSILVFGDLSKSTGGQLLPHLSHRNGRDADLLLYAATLDGAPVASPGFIHYGPDGLAWDPAGKRFLRFDVERQWLLLRSLLNDDDARIQWVFINHNVRARILEWARALGEPLETIWRATQVMAEPHPGGAHDDHVHVRTACTLEEMASGCEHSGPMRPWLAPKERPPVETSDEELVAELLKPLDGVKVLAASVPTP